jgi:hypothetical protein
VRVIGLKQRHPYLPYGHLLPEGEEKNYTPICPMKIFPLAGEEKTTAFIAAGKAWHLLAIA